VIICYREAEFKTVSMKLRKSESQTHSQANRAGSIAARHTPILWACLQTIWMIAERAKKGLEFRAGVGIDFAIQANFFKSWSCPLHDSPLK
jgi:hypothetical protein